MFKLNHILKSKKFFIVLFVLFAQVLANAQEESVIDNKGTIIKIRNNVVTTSATSPSSPLQNDVWFDTTAEVTKVFDGSAWLIINLDELAKKEDSANKSVDTNLSDVTNTKFPTELAVKTYVDTEVTASADDDITGVSFDGTNLQVDEGLTSFSADLSGLRDSDWFEANTTNPTTDISQNIYTLGNVGIGTNDPQRGLHIAGANSVIRLSRSSNTAAMIFDRYSGTVNNTLKSFLFGVNASTAGTGEFFVADYNENISGPTYTRLMTFTDGNEVIRFDQYGTGNFASTTSSYLLGVESDGDIVEVDASNLSGHSFYEEGTTSAPDNINDNMYTQGNIGIGTTSPDAQLDIESTGVPLKIAPSTTTPAGTQAGQIFMGSNGILYAFDGSRGKWLSVDRTMVGWGRSNGNTSNQYLRQFNGSVSNNNGWRMIRDGTITGISAQSNAADSWTLEIRKNDSSTVIASLTMTAQEGNHSNTLDIDIDEGDFLQAYCNGVSVAHPQSLIEIAWRK